MIKGSIFQEDIPIFKPFKSKLNGEIDKLLAVVIGDTNIFLLVTDRSSRQKINKDITDVRQHYQSLGPVNIYRLSHPTTAGIHILLKPTQEHHLKNTILGHKTHLSKFERLKVTQKHLSDHNGIKPEINNRNDNWKKCSRQNGIISEIYRQMKRKQ